MEIEKRQPEMGKKLWNIVRVVLYMMRRSKARRKIMTELNTLVKKGKNAGKAIIQQSHHYSALTCRPNDANTAFVSPRDYEFSCSNTPLPKRKSHQADDLKLMQKVFGILSRYDVVAEASPLPTPEIDRDAEEFINNFYRELRKQRPLEASPYHEWAT